VDSSSGLDVVAHSLALRRGNTQDPEIRSRHARRVRRGVYCLDPQRKPCFLESVVAALLVLPRGSVAYSSRGCRSSTALSWSRPRCVPIP
jgi:hypothetical protein